MMIITPCLATTRLSILAFYHRLFPTRSFRIALWVVAIIVFAQAIIFFFLLAFPCIPIRAVWSRLEDSKCMDYYTVYLAQAGFNVPIDSIILVMPMIIIWRLQMTLRRKLALTVTFVIGSG